MSKIVILFLFLLQSCAETAIGGLIFTSMVFTRYDTAIFNSRLIRGIKSDINRVLYKNNNPKSSVQIAQDGNSVYIIGSVSSNNVKTEVLDAVSQKLGGSYIDEIAVNSLNRSYIKDAILKMRLKGTIKIN